MTSQRRRPDQTQRRLAIQASSRRSRTSSASTAGRREERWERESYRGDNSFEEPSRPSFRSDYNDEHHADRFQPSRHEIKQARSVGRSNFGDQDERYQDERYQDERYQDERVHANRHVRNAYDSHWDEPMDNRRYYNDADDSYRQPDAWGSRESYGQSRGRSELDQDLEAMGKVWSMIRQGAVRMLGEVGRQY